MPTAKEMVEFVQNTYDPDEVVAYDIYDTGDVKFNFEVSDDEAREALEYMHDNKDANVGYNWEVLRGALDEIRRLNKT